MRFRKVPLSAKVPVHRKFSYGIGGLGDTFMSDILEGYLSYFFIANLGINPVLVGIGVMIPRLWDMVTDPFMGNFSDNFRSKYGRRRPFILIGGILACVPFVLVWMVPESWGEMGQFAWLVVSMLIYSTFYTVYYIPYNSLGAELSTDYNERTNVSTIRLLVARIGGLLMAPLFEVVYNKELFASEQTGYTVVALVFAALSTLGYIWLFLDTKEETQVQTQEKINLVESVKYTFKNPAFVMLLVITVLGGFAFWSVVRLGRFVAVYYVHGGSEESLGRINTISEYIGIAVSFVSIVVINWMSRHWGKLTTRIIISVSTMLIQCSSWFLFDPERPYLFIVFQGGLGVFYASYIVALSMMADVADYDELQTGCRREGMFFGVWGLVQKTSFSVGPLISGLVLTWIGFEEGVKIQSEHTLWWMRFIFAFGGMPIYLIMLGILFKYPLTEKRVREMRTELDKRRGENSPD